MTMPIDLRDVLQKAEALRYLCSEAEGILNRYSGAYLPTSPAALEVDSSPHEELLKTAYYLGSHTVLVTVDHTLSLHRGLTGEPQLTYSVWSAARNILEASSKCVWLLDKPIDPMERITRSLNIRLTEIRDAQKYLRNLVTKCPAQTQGINQEILASNVRIADLRNQVGASAFPEKLDKKGKFLGWGTGPQSISTRINFAFKDSESTYSWLSPALHGDTWALRALGSHVERGEHPQEHPDLSPDYALWLIVMAIKWFTKSLWTLCELYGWDIQQLRVALEALFDHVGMGQNTRFWR